MNDNWKIEDGDLVRVNFNNAQFTLVKKGQVMGHPWDVGDSWKIKDLETGEIHYISEGCTLTKLKSVLPYETNPK